MRGDWRRLVAVPAAAVIAVIVLRGLRELHFTGEVVATCAEFDGTPMKTLGAPIILYPMRNAVDYAVDALTAIIRNNQTVS
ncbi:hypothetical protein [Propionivibrio sp.]|uniref:hypothetical protein n=1 Tax=Propionivibrio sp. TaxID=2212460 RepID=UPI003BF393EE